MIYMIDEIDDRKIERFIKKGFVFIGISFAIGLTLSIGLIYTAFHFISKYW